VRRRRAVATGALLALALATAAHVGYWYFPRERPGLPSGVARRQLGEAGNRAAVWIPYPHQNLAILERRVGDLWRLCRSLRGEDGCPRSLPDFGPFVVPPGRELVLVLGREELSVDLETYPAVARLAKLAGWVARNPWLSGGVVQLRSGGRTARVSWDGSRWRLRSDSVAPGPEAEQPPGAARSAEPALARLHSPRPIWLLPAGEYRLVRIGGALEVRSGQPPEGSLQRQLLSDPPPAAWVAERTGRKGARATVVWSDEGAVPPFPASAVLQRGRVGRLRLPGEELLRLTGNRPPHGRAAGFEVRGLGGLELRRGLAVAPQLAGRLRSDRRRVVEAVVFPELLAPAAGRVAERFQGLPISRLLGADPALWSAVLGVFEGCPATVLEVWRRPAATRWRLCTAFPEPAAPN